MKAVQHDETWLRERLEQAATLCNVIPETLPNPDEELYLGVDLGTSNIVCMVVDGSGMPRAVQLKFADVVRDGVVWDFFGAVTILKAQLETISQQLGREFTVAATSFPPGTEPRISVNVLEAAGLIVKNVLDEPTAVAHMMDLKSAAVVDIGGGTTGVAVVRNGKVIFSNDEPTGGTHITLTLAGGMRVSTDEAEVIKKERGKEIWPRVRPVFEKMTHIVSQSLKSPELKGYQVKEIILSGGSCTLPGVRELFAAVFPAQNVVLPWPPIFITPLAIACSDIPRAESRGGKHGI